MRSASRSKASAATPDVIGSPMLTEVASLALATYQASTTVESSVPV